MNDRQELEESISLVVALSRSKAEVSLLKETLASIHSDGCCEDGGLCKWRIALARIESGGL